MTTDSNKPNQTDDEQSLANLLRLGGERPEIPLSIESRVYHRVQQEWQASTKEPNAEKVYASVHKSWKAGVGRGWVLRWFAPLGVAASLVLAFLLLSQPEPVAPVSVATVAGVVSPTASSARFSAGATVFEGDVVETGPDGGLSLLLARNATLRIDANSRIRVESADHFTLERGRIYADTGLFTYRNGGLTIDTPHGIVRDIGTQFAVSTDTGLLNVAVREGRVELASEAAVYGAKMGEQLTLVPGQLASVSELDTHSAYWDWIVDLTPAYDMKDKSLLDFLKWATRETGRHLQFETDESRMFAMRTDVYASIDGLTPDEALEAILSTTTLDYRIELDKVVLLQHSVK